MGIWCWGPETEGANVVVDTTQAVQYLIEIKEHVNSAFQWTAKEGPLCEENMRGIRFNIMDVTLHTDSIQATSGQAFPQCVFDHWENLQGDATEEGSKLQELILKTRKRKNIKVEMPKLGDYLDKL